MFIIFAWRQLQNPEKKEVAAWDVFVKKWGHLYSFWHQYHCCNVKKWLILLSAALPVLHQFPLFNCWHFSQNHIFWRENLFTVPSFKHLSHCSVNIICAISLLFWIESRQQLKVKWFPISWNTFSFNNAMKKHRDSNRKCLIR